MRWSAWSWLPVAILGLAIGSIPAPEEPDLDLDMDTGDSGEVWPDRAVGRVVRGVNFHVWDEDSREAMGWAGELLEAAGETVASTPWRTLAARTAALPPLLAQLGPELETQLATSAAGLGSSDLPPLGILLCLLPSLDRTCLISSWATSPNEQVRQALAGALAAPFEAVGVPTVLEQLQRDPSAAVQQRARAAAAIRRGVLG